MLVVLDKLTRLNYLTLERFLCAFDELSGNLSIRTNDSSVLNLLGAMY